MEIIERKAAFAAGLKQYFTGKACKAGHTAYRYVKSGTCSDCVAAARTSYSSTPTDTNPESDKLRVAQLRASSRELILKKFRAFDLDSLKLMNMAASLCAARYPLLSIETFETHVSATLANDGMAMYKVKIHPEDVDVLLAYGMSMFRRRTRGGAQLEQDRIERERMLQQMMLAEIPEYDYEKVSIK